MSDKLSTEARRYLADELRRTEVEVSAVDEQLAALTAKRAALARKAELLRAEAGAELIEQATDADERRGEPRDGNGHGGMSFRAYIRDALTGAGKGMAPAEVAEAVKARGYRYESVQDANSRTQAELYRMAKLGQIAKRGRLYFPRSGKH